MTANRNPSFTFSQTFPNEITDHMGSFVDRTSLGHLSRICRNDFGLFNNHLKKHTIANQLLKEVINADPQAVEALLKQYSRPAISLATIKTFGKEECGRQWKAVSSLEFAVWAGDKEIVEMLLKYVPDHYKSEALQQLRDIKAKGTEQGMPLEAYHSFIRACQIYNKSYGAWHDDWRSKNYYWRQVIGTRQRELPMCGLQWFYDDEAFYPLPQFTRPPNRFLPKISNFKLGIDFALRKGIVTTPLEMVQSPPPQLDRAAFTYLCALNIQTLDRLIAQLQAQVEENKVRMPYISK